jgi:Uma2 family endonuclease
MTLQEIASPQPAESRRWYPPPQGRWTYDDYRHLPDDSMRYEVIEGNLYMSPAPLPRHQIILGEIYARFRQFAREQDRGQVIFAPIDVVLDPGAVTVQPDLVYVAKENLDIIQETNIWGVPDLLLEVVSPGNVAHDRKTKYHAYAAAGVREYWIVDADAQTIDVFVLRGRAYAPLGHFAADDKAESEVLPGFSLSVAAVLTTNVV